MKKSLLNALLKPANSKEKNLSLSEPNLEPNNPVPKSLSENKQEILPITKTNLKELNNLDYPELMLQEKNLIPYS
jgi:hypothetical protein